MKEIGLYIHIPFCKKKCLYCDFNSYDKTVAVDAYVDGLINEIEAYQYTHAFKYKTVFIGGGTPTFIHYTHIERIMEKLRPFICADAEVTMECNPGTVTQQSLEHYKQAGINRLSIGLQAWQDNLLRKIGRIHKKEDFLQCYRWARLAGFDNINADLMFALPGQTLEDWEETLNHVCDLGIEHLSCYSLKLEEGTRLFELCQAGDINLPNEDIDRQMYHAAVAKLKSCGYVQYEISNFAKVGFICKHNLIYWNNEEYLGVGAGSHSKLGKRRFWNIKDLDSYIVQTQKLASFEEINAFNKDNPLIEGAEWVDTAEEMWETIFLRLRLNEGLNLAAFDKKYNVCFVEKYENQLSQLKADGLVDIKNGFLQLTEKGLDLSNIVFMAFMDS